MLVPAAVGLLALAAAVGQVLVLGRLQWFDVYADWAVSLVRGRLPLDILAVTSAAPYIGTAFVVLGIVVARRRGARSAAMLRVLLALGAGLLVVAALKGLLHRDRPCTLLWAPPQRDSFPSGHTAHVALCVVAAVQLASLRSRRRDALRAVIAVAGIATAVVIGFTRLYLARHWLTDVTTSLMLALAFWGLGDVLRRVRLSRLWPALAVVMLVVGGLLACGVQVFLPSPTTFDDHGRFDLSLVRLGGGHRRRAAVPPTRRLLNPARRTIRLPIWTAASDWAVLKLLATPRGPSQPLRCKSIGVRIDGRDASTRRLERHREIYAFALPPLAVGPHELRLRLRSACGASPAGAPPVAVHRVSIDGVNGRFMTPAPGMIASRRGLD